MRPQVTCGVRLALFNSFFTILFSCWKCQILAQQVRPIVFPSNSDIDGANSTEFQPQHASQFCQRFLDCETLMLRIQERCTAKSRHATGKDCQTSQQFRWHLLETLWFFYLLAYSWSVDILVNIYFYIYECFILIKQ